MADKRKIDRKTRQAVRKKDGEIWQTEKKRAERYGRQNKDRQKDTAGCQKERRRDLADKLAAAEKTSESLIVAEPETSLPDEKIGKERRYIRYIR